MLFCSAELVREKAFVTMEVDPPPPPEAPPPLPPVVGITSEDRFAALDAPVLLPDFPGQPFSVSIDVFGVPAPFAHSMECICCMYQDYWHQIVVVTIHIGLKHM